MEQHTTASDYSEGYKAGYQHAQAFYTRRGRHAHTVARHWRSLPEHPKGPRSLQVLTTLFPDLVRTLDALATHELDHTQI